MPATDWALDAFSLESLKKALFGGLSGALDAPEGFCAQDAGAGRGARAAVRRQPLPAGASMGTPWEIDTRGKILFLEDVNEKSYRVDSMLTQLRNGGKFDDCAGIILGHWTDCEPEDESCALTLKRFLSSSSSRRASRHLRFACGHSMPHPRRCRWAACANWTRRRARCVSGRR